MARETGRVVQNHKQQLQVEPALQTAGQVRLIYL